MPGGPARIFIDGMSLQYTGGYYDRPHRHGQTFLDGSGSAPYAGDLAIRGDRIVAIGSFANARAKREIDATGLVSLQASSTCWANRNCRC